MQWDTEERSESEPIAAFRNSFAVDGWSVEGGQLVPNTAVALAEPRSRLRRLLQECGAHEAIRRLGQLEKGLDEGHWESANGDARGFLNSVFEVIAGALPQTRAQDLKEGAARSALQEVFNLADYVQVKGATLDNGLLQIDLVREIPEAMKPLR